MIFGSLFSGIGGFDLGFQKAGLECAWQVEIDKDCQRVLKRQWPNVQRFDDVSTVREFSAVDVLCGGFPCQDLSVAGKRAGLAGERSGLWFEFLRIIKSNQPRWVVIENVPGLLSSASGADYKVIVDGLVNVGYCIGWRVFDAQYFGVAQRRRRVFIVGSLGNGSCAEILFESESVPWNPPTRREAREGASGISVRRAQGGSNGWGVKTDGTSKWAKGTGDPAGDEAYNLVTHALRSEGADASEDGTGRGTPIVVAATLNSGGNSGGFRTEPGAHLVAFSIAENQRGEIRTGDVSPQLSCSGGKPGSGYSAVAFESRVARNGRGTPSDIVPPLKAESGQTGKGDSAPLTAGSFGVRRLTPRECERLQGFPDDWTLYDAEGKVISDSARYRMLGNAVEVDCAEWIGKRIFSRPARDLHTESRK